MPKIARFLIIFLLVAGWIFAGWPQIFNFPPVNLGGQGWPPIWQNLKIPPKIEGVQAATIYQRMPNEINATSPISFTVSMDEYIGNGYDSGCNLGTATKTFYQGMPYWGLAFLNKDRSDFIAVSDELVPSTTLSHTFIKNFPAGTEIGEVIFICSETPQIPFNEWYLTQYTGNDLEVLNATNPLTITSIAASSTPQ